MDAGPVWGDPHVPDRRRRAVARAGLYNGPVADAAIELVREVVEKATDPTFVPEPLDDHRPPTSSVGCGR